MTLTPLLRSLKLKELKSPASRVAPNVLRFAETYEQREALVLVGASGFAYEEAAEMCGVATGTIKSRVNRARARLAELLHLDDDEALELTDTATIAVVGNPGLPA